MGVIALGIIATGNVSIAPTGPKVRISPNERRNITCCGAEACHTWSLK